MIVIEVFARGCEPRWRPTPTGSTLMTGPPLSAAAFPFLCAGSTLATISRDRFMATMRPDPSMPFKQPGTPSFALLPPRVKHAGRVAATSRPIECGANLKSP